MNNAKNDSVSLREFLAGRSFVLLARFDLLLKSLRLPIAPPLTFFA